MCIMHITTLLLAALLPVVLANPFSEEDSGSSEKGNQPNIIFIFADDLGYNDIGYNNPKVHTPVLDKLAKDGRILTQYYVQSICAPSRRALMSGMYPWKFEGYPCLPTNMPILPELLKELGYQTHMLGKWHLGYCQEKCLPTRRGFDTFSGIYSGMGDFYNHTTTGTGTRYYDWHRGLHPDKTVFGKYTTDVISSEAVNILENHDPDDGPFFLYVAHTAVHVPLQVAQKFIDLYPNEPEWRRAIYLGMVSAMDEQTGIMMDTLERLGLKDDTIIVFSSDNGGEAVIGPSDNSPYRGGKGTVFEGGNRVPCFISGKGVTRAGTRHDGLMASIDWLPTLVKLAKGETDKLELDGVDQGRMVMHGAKSKRKDYVYRMHMGSSRLGNCAIRDEDNFKLIWGFEGPIDGYGRDAHVNNDPGWVKIGHPNDIADPVLDIVSPYWLYYSPQVRKLLAEGIAAAIMDPNDINSGKVHLFNIADDPEERHDLAALPEYSGKVLEMKKRILKLTEEMTPAPSFPPYGDRLAIMVDNTLTTGYCEDFDIVI